MEVLALIGIAALVAAGIYWVTTLDFEWGSGFSERKDRAREAEYSIEHLEKKENESGGSEKGHQNERKQLPEKW